MDEDQKFLQENNNDAGEIGNYGNDSASMRIFLSYTMKLTSNKTC